MTTATLTLTDFLLARITEDEADAEHWRYTSANGYGRARVLAECRARRRIMDVDWRADDSGPADAVRDDVLRLLALPYADHPHYLPEWQPST